MSDRLARALASAALAVALVALLLAGWAVSLGIEYRDGVQTLGRTLQDMARQQPGKALDVPLRRPPPTLDPDPN